MQLKPLISHSAHYLFTSFFSLENSSFICLLPPLNLDKPSTCDLTSCPPSNTMSSIHWLWHWAHNSWGSSGHTQLNMHLSPCTVSREEGFLPSTERIQVSAWKLADLAAKLTRSQLPKGSLRHLESFHPPDTACSHHVIASSQPRERLLDVTH